LDAPKNGHEDGCLYLAARAYLDNDTSTVVKRDLSDADLECSGHSENILFDHAPDCPITLHRALMKELE